ncbi:MAG: class I SAM-dependent methyltransferase [bacterium]|nr:class I SAM-dependent methyltransferase [bacterium]
MQVDLENLAAGYSHRPASAAALARARLAASSANLDAGCVGIDIGGGRGHHAATWLEWHAVPIVVDPSAGMSKEASRHKGVHTVRAYSQFLPFRNDTARLAYFHLSLHYGDWKAALDEVGRVVMSGGECWIWTMGEQHHRASFLARWFPSIGDIDMDRFPDPQEVAAYLDATCASVIIDKDIEEKVSTAAQWRRAVEARFVSTLQLISDQEFCDGLEAYDARYPDPDEPVEYVLTFDRIRTVI